MKYEINVGAPESTGMKSHIALIIMKNYTPRIINMQYHFTCHGFNTSLTNDVMCVSGKRKTVFFVKNSICGGSISSNVHRIQVVSSNYYIYTFHLSGETCFSLLRTICLFDVISSFISNLFIFNTEIENIYKMSILLPRLKKCKNDILLSFVSYSHNTKDKTI